MTTVDTRGYLCPQPLIMTRRAISAAMAGDEFKVLTDNDTARCNLMSYLTELGLSPICREDFDDFLITFTTLSANGTEVEISAESFCSPSPVDVTSPTSTRIGTTKSGYMVAIASDKMGRGDDDLGALLMRGCINSLIELDRLPSAIVIYNSGVKLAVSDTDTAASLIALRDRGVDVICCGTCVDFFELKDQMGVGRISNMLTINELLINATHIIYP